MAMAGQYRYARGQQNHGTVGGHIFRPTGHRTASPEPGGLGGEGGKERGMGANADEAAINYAEEYESMRNQLHMKDERIAALTRGETAAGPLRMKKDMRELASELHKTRTQLKTAQDHISRLEAASRDSAARGTVDSPSGAASGAGGRGSAASEREIAALKEQLKQVEEENRHLKDTLKASQTAARQNGLAAAAENTDGVQHARQPSGASTQRVVEPGGGAPGTGGYPMNPMGSMPVASAGQYIASTTPPVAHSVDHVLSSQGVATGQVAVPVSSGGMVGVAPPEDNRQMVYSSLHEDHIVTIGPTALQGVGTVDGVASVAKVLLQRIECSICFAGQPGQHAPRRGNPQVYGNPQVQQQAVPLGGMPQQPM